MKILYIASMNSIHSVRWIEYFARIGLSVHVVNVGTSDHVPIPEATYHDGLTRPNVKGGVLRQYMNAYRPFKTAMKNILTKVNPDIVHVHGISIYAYIAKRCGFTPVVATALGSEVLVDPSQSLKYRLIVRKALAAVDLITCDAEHIKDQMVKQGAARNSVEIIYFGTDIKQFSPAKRDPQLNEQLGFSPGTRLVVSLRSLRSPIYDIGTLIQAIPNVIRDQKRVGFIIVGDGDERPHLEKLCNDLGVQQHTKFVGRLSNDDLQRYTASADVYVSTSLSDAGIAASTAEAMACEVPSVITDFGNNADWIQNDLTGYLFPMRDSKTLAARISQILANPDDARTMGERARKVIAMRNNWENEMAKVMQLYKRLAS